MDGAEEDKVVMALLAVQVEEGILLARSQAKRVAHRFERFSRVELDFTGVSEIGRAFADELFRVFAAAHPAIRITPINTQPAVEQMIRRAVAAGVASRYRGWHTTSSSAGRPDFTTASARFNAALSSRGSLIGPSAHTPCACANLA